MIEKKEKNEKTMREYVSIFSILLFVPLQHRGYAGFCLQTMALISPKDDEMV
ncbi:hypothetical protein ACIGEH_01710 [Bacillus altitudinis]|uniref:hypothetical protein n=1 Tax=Bacillus TaxID=1386 RepID=UPI0003A7FE49